jgi:hypothetical protein
MTTSDWDALRKQEQQAAFRKKYGMPNPDPEAEFERDVHGDIRHTIHANHATSRPLSKGYEQVGIAGEQAFAAFLGTDWDRATRPEGSGGINQRINGYTINVYTARKPLNLLVEQGKATVDIYVLAGYLDADRTAYLKGWATKAMVLAAPVRDRGGRGVMSHVIPADDLSDMEALRDVLVPKPQTKGLWE